MIKPVYIRIANMSAGIYRARFATKAVTLKVLLSDFVSKKHPKICIGIGRQKEQTDSARKQQTDLDGIGKTEIHNSSDANVARMDKSMTDVTDKGEYVETKENEPVDKVSWIVRRISELGGYGNVSDSDKADIFGLDIADVSGSIRLFSDVMKRMGIKLDGDEMYEEFQRIYDESVSRDADKKKVEDRTQNRG